MSRLEEIRIEFWFNDRPFAERHQVQIPNVQDNIYFNGKRYNIIKREWFYDKNETSVIIFITDK